MSASIALLLVGYAHIFAMMVCLLLAILAND